MNTIEELIQKECPEGVEYKPLWSLTAWDKNFNGVDKSMQKIIIKYHYYLANELNNIIDDTGDVKILTTNKSNKYTSDALAGNNISYGEVVAIPWGGNLFIQYHKGKFVTTDNRIATSLDINTLSNKFLYYWMLSQYDVIEGFYRGAGIKHPSMKDVLTLEIPVPPLSVQHKIVEILDKFTSLEAELEAELEARKKQYEYYRNQLLDFTGREDVEFRKIGDITNVFSASRVHKHEWKTEGVPFWRSSDLISFFNGVENSRGKVFISPELYEKLSAKSGKIQKDDILVTGGGTIGIPYIVPNNLPMYVKDADLLCIVHNDLFCSKFLYHYMLSSKFRKYLSDITHDATIAHYTITQIKDTPIPIPPLTEQLRIVTILDKFEALINGQTASLSAEIKARHQQYEYYRDRLLTFCRKEN